MNLKNGLIFLGGCALGAVSTYFILKDKYEQQANEEAEQLKNYYEELYSNKEETVSEEVDEKEEINKVEVFANGERKEEQRSREPVQSDGESLPG